MTAAAPGGDRQVGLLDLVPITLGRLHTGVLRTLLLLEDQVAGPNVRALVGLARDEIPAPEELRFEYPVRGRKVDLAVLGRKRIAIETKVGDSFNWDQFSAYGGDEGWEPVLFAPMVTGYLVADNLTKPGDYPWTKPISSIALLGATDQADLPPLIREYLGEIRKFDDLRQIAEECAGAIDQLPSSSDGDRAIVDATWQVAWVRAVKKGAVAADGSDRNWYLRSTQNDFGMWWGKPGGEGNWSLVLPGGGTVEIYVDVRAARHDFKRSVRLIVAGGTPEEKARAHELLTGVCPDDWRLGQRRFSKGSLSAWTWEGRSACEATAAAARAQASIQQLVGGY